MTLLQQRKLRILAKRILRNDKQEKLYLLNLHWLKIRKQKERRRRKTLKKLGVYNRRKYNRWMIPM